MPPPGPPRPMPVKSKAPDYVNATKIINTEPVPAPASPVAVASPSRPLLRMEDVANFGTSTLSKAAAISSKIAETTKVGDIDELGKSLNELVDRAKGYDPARLKGLFGLIRRKVHDIKQNYATVDGQVSNMVAEVDKRVVLFRSRVRDLNALYDANEAYKVEIKRSQADLQARVAEAEASLPEVVEGDLASAQRRSEIETVISMARKRIDDFERAYTLCVQQGPQIQLMAANSISLSQAFDDIKATTIPALRNAYTLYILNVEQEKGAQVAKSVRDTTNATIQANARKLGATTEAVQSVLGESTVTVESLKVVNDELIKAIGIVQQKRTEMHERLQRELPEIQSLSRDLAARIAPAANQGALTHG